MMMTRPVPFDRQVSPTRPVTSGVAGSLLQAGVATTDEPTVRLPTGDGVGAAAGA